jgi:hypothetical protein
MSIESPTNEDWKNENRKRWSESAKDIKRKLHEMANNPELKNSSTFDEDLIKYTKDLETLEGLIAEE